MSANTSSVPCFSLYNLDLQRNVWYTQPLSTAPSDGTDKMYPRMTLLGAAIALNQCTPSTTQETEQRLPLSLDTGETIYHSKHLVYILFQHTKMHTNDKITASHTFLVSGQTRASLSVSQGHASSSRGHFFLPEGTLSLPACRGTVNQPSIGYDQWVE